MLKVLNKFLKKAIFINIYIYIYINRSYDKALKQNKNNFNPLSANPQKRSNTIKQFAGKLFECVWPFCEVRG